MRAISARRWFKGIAIASTIALGSTVIGIFVPGQSTGLSWLFGLRGPIQPPDNVVVVAINEQTPANLNLPASVGDWPRSIHGTLVDNLVARGASTIVFDVFFRAPKNLEDDTQLARALEDANRVVLVEQLTSKRQPLFDDKGTLAGSLYMEELIPPDAMFAGSARGLAPFPLPKLDAAVYEFWTYKDSASNAPTLPAMALQVHGLSVIDEWFELVLNSGLPVPGNLSPDSLSTASADDLSAAMKTYRSLLLDNPQAAQRIFAQLEEAQFSSGTSLSTELLWSLFNLYTGFEHRYINFYGPPGTIPTIPYENVIAVNPTFPVPDLTDKVVFVGQSDLYNPSQPDRFYTVFTGEDGVDLSGVEIAATVFGNLYTNTTLVQLDIGPTIAILFALGFLLFAVIYFLPAAIGVPVALVLAAVYFYSSFLAFTEHSLLVPLAVPVLIQLPLALLLGLIAQYRLERHHGQRISEAIAYYLPENIARDLTENTLDPNKINNVVFSTCLATDMAGFSTIAEKMPPDKLAIFLNEYFETLARALKKHKVDVTEFRADAIMCAWTGDEASVAVREKPILAALDAVKAIDEFKVKYGNLAARLRVGLESGSVYVGHAGGGGHFVYSIVGDCANTASRIEGLNKHLGTRVLVTRKVVTGLEKKLILRPMGTFQFVGKGGGLPIVEVLGLAADVLPEQSRYCELFASALRLFDSGDWAATKQSFEEYLTDFPGDGPAEFYVKLCGKYLENGYVNEEAGLVRMDQK